jgi:hypothetical protein
VTLFKDEKKSQLSKWRGFRHRMGVNSSEQSQMTFQNSCALEVKRTIYSIELINRIDIKRRNSLGNSFSSRLDFRIVFEQSLMVVSTPPLTVILIILSSSWLLHQNTDSDTEDIIGCSAQWALTATNLWLRFEIYSSHYKLCESSVDHWDHYIFLTQLLRQPPCFWVSSDAVTRKSNRI